MKKNCTVGQATDDSMIWHMYIACWIPKATSTYSEYVTSVTFSLQQWLYEHASMLRYTYIACLFYANAKYPLNYSMCTLFSTKIKRPDISYVPLRQTRDVQLPS
jgi:hypothetical protein